MARDIEVMCRRFSGSITLFLCLLAAACLCLGLLARPAAAATTEKIYYSLGQGDWDLRHIDTDGTGDVQVYGLLDPAQGYVTQLAIDPIDGKVYFWDPYEDTIFKSDLDGSNRSVWLSTTVNVYCLSAYNGKVYYTLLEGDYDLVRRDADGTNPFIIVTLPAPSIETVYFTAIDPVEGMLYYYIYEGDGSANNNIYKTDLADPKSPSTGATALLNTSKCIKSLEAYNGKVYYGLQDEAPNNYYLMRMDSDGTDITQVFYPTDGTIDQIAVAPTEGKLYCYESTLNNLYKFDLTAALPVVAPPQFMSGTILKTLEIYSPPAAPEMNLKQGVTNIADGGSYGYGNHLVGSNTDITFTIENTGTADLTITLDLTLGGANADQFSITDQPDATVAASGTTTFTVRFSPTSAGAKTATIDIANNDSNENPYNLTLNGTGTVSPAISNLDGDAVTFTEGGGAVLLDAGGNAAVTDDDASGYNGGAVTVAISGGGTANEDLSILTGAGVTLSAGMTNGSTVTVDGTTIGIIDTTGQNGANLVIDLNANASNALLSTLLQNINYINNSDDPPATRTINFTVSDTLDTSAAAAVTVTLQGVNDPPTLTGTGQNPTFTEGGVAVDLFSAVTVSTIEAGQSIEELVLTVTNVNDGTSEIMNIDGSNVALTDGNSVTTATNSMDATVSTAGSTATVTITKAGGISAAAMQTLVDGMTYRNTSDNPNNSNRVVTLTSIKDTGGTANGGGDTTALAVTSTVTVTAVNDPPSITNFNGDSVSVIAGWGTGLIDENSDASVTDADSADFDGGYLYIVMTGGIDNGNFGLDGTNVTSGGDATIAAGETIAIGGVSIGTVDVGHDGQGGNSLVINFSASATPARVATLIKNITYAAPSGLGARTFVLFVNDGDGTDNGGQDTSVASTFTINVTPNPPVIANLNGDAINYDPFVGGESLLDANNNGTVTDADSPNFNSGNITVTVSAGGTPVEDRLGIFTGGTVTLSVGVTVGSVVSVGGTAIGTITSDGTGGNDLVVTFNANATPARVTTLLRALTYENTNNINPSLAARSIEVTITDASAGSNPATSDAAVITVNMLSPEINLKQGATDIADGGSYNFGNHYLATNTDITFTIQNTGGGGLTLTTPITIGGANADQFSIQQQPASPVAASGSTTFTVRFRPTSIGAKTATIAIANNDADEDPYDLTIQGTGFLSPPTGDGSGYYYEYINMLGTKYNLITSYTGQVYTSVEATSPDGRLTINIPAGTVITNENGQGLHTLEVNVNDNPPPPPEGAHIIGLPYNFTPNGATFDPPITLTFNYKPEDIPEGVSEEDLVLAFYDEENGVWVELECICDPDTNCIIACVSHFTSFVILGKEIILPASFSLSDLTVVPAEVKPGEVVTVTVTVTNTGGVEGAYTLILQIDGVELETKNVVIIAGDVVAVSFTVNREEPGTYNLNVNGIAASFEVTEPEPTPTPTTAAPTTPAPAPTTAAPTTPALTLPVLSPTTTPEGKGFNWPLVGGIIGGVVIIGLVIILFSRRRD